MNNELEYARVIEHAYRVEQKKSEKILAVDPERCTGKSFYNKYFRLLRRIDSELVPKIQSNNITAQEFCEEVGVCLYRNKYNLNGANSFLKTAITTDRGIDFITSRIVSKKDLTNKYKTIMKSILLSLQYLCKATIKKDETLKPSQFFNKLVANKSLGRYINNGISYYFLACVTDIDDIIQKCATTHIDPLNPKVKVIDYEYAKMIESMPIFKQEVKAACEFCGFVKGDILNITDSYYMKHKTELIEECQKA